VASPDDLGIFGVMEKTKKGAQSVRGRSIQAAALIEAPAPIVGFSRRLSTTGRDADIAEIRDRLDRVATDLAALKRDVVDLKSRSRRPRKKGRSDANQLKLLFDARSASPDPISGGKPDEKEKD
jgi:hypothetical protein